MNDNSGDARNRALESIRSNIEKHGHHVYLVVGGETPNFLYTIGLRESLEFELVWTGAAYFSHDDALYVVNQIAKKLKSGLHWKDGPFDIDSEAEYTLRAVHPSWPDELWLGALDYYDVDSIPVLQIVPEEKYRTLDIPDMSQEWNPESEPVWRWLTEEWNYPVPKKSIAVTNLDALRGKPVTEVVRWEEEEWEMFAGAGPDVDEEDARWVPLGTLIGIDQTLYPAANLGIGKGIWRDDEEMKWHRWESSTD